MMRLETLERSSNRNEMGIWYSSVPFMPSGKELHHDHQSVSSIMHLHVPSPGVICPKKLAIPLNYSLASNVASSGTVHARKNKMIIMSRFEKTTYCLADAAVCSDTARLSLIPELHGSNNKVEVQ